MKETIPESKAERVARILEGEIRSGTLSDGAVLSSEHSLVQRFAVSRSTVRKGLGILLDKGLIETRVGIGSFVTFGGELIDSRAGWSLALSDKGARLGTRILLIDRRAMDLEASDIVRGAEVLAVDRIRFREETGQALSLERSRVPWQAGFQPVLTEGLAGGSLSRTMAALGLVPAGGVVRATVLTGLTDADAALMGRRAGEPMLHLQRLSRNDAGAVVEYVESLLDPAVFALRMEF
ncbi:GntR family transcriptional regulator [Sedimentitalea sp. XS_ASV28]|uniref:GntR family transcriptional regulator n=1 Tax=Sedimentitalea sp. XS_ASV28 TaxID=3241296 RepID=UPI0035118168